MKVPTRGPVAQLGARFHGMEEVVSSNLTRSTNLSIADSTLAPRDAGWSTQSVETLTCSIAHMSNRIARSLAMFDSSSAWPACQELK